jgi:hypothetical protein
MGVMTQNGKVLIWLGIVLLVGGFFVPISRPLVDAYPLPSEVVNLQGLHIQALVFEAAFASIITGTITLGFGLVLEKMDATAAAPKGKAEGEAEDEEAEVSALLDPVAEEERRMARVLRDSSRDILISLAIIALIAIAVFGVITLRS